MPRELCGFFVASGASMEVYEREWIFEWILCVMIPCEIFIIGIYQIKTILTIFNNDLEEKIRKKCMQKPSEAKTQNSETVHVTHTQDLGNKIMLQPK